MFSTSTLVTVPALALAWLYADSLPFSYVTRIYSHMHDIKRRLAANNNKPIRKQSTENVSLQALIHVRLLHMQLSFQPW